MRLSEHKDLKIEIKSLPEKEKDKLLLRLIAKDTVLTEHLHFKLLEDEYDLAQRYERLKNWVDENITELLNSRKLNSKETIIRMRSLVGAINHHFKVTRDVSSDIELRIHLLNRIPISFNEGVFSPMHKYNEKLNVYFVKTTMAVLVKLEKMHEDIQFDLNESTNQILNKIYNNRSGVVALELGLPKEL